jgi:hypothetical protein
VLGRTVESDEIDERAGCWSAGSIRPICTAAASGADPVMSSDPVLASDHVTTDGSEPSVLTTRRLSKESFLRSSLADKS